MVRDHIQTTAASQCNSTGEREASIGSVSSVRLTFGVELVTATPHYSGESLLNGRAQVGGQGSGGEQGQTM